VERVQESLKIKQALSILSIIRYIDIVIKWHGRHMWAHVVLVRSLELQLG
jgi:hypothetical protein